MRNRNRAAIAAVATAIGIVLLRGAAPAAGQQEPFKTWSKQIPKAAQRFKVLSEFGGHAVLDKETGLVWEKAPATTNMAWAYALAECRNRTTGGRKGWRLPAIEELTSLLDATSAPAVLPAGHPFVVDDTFYWSATSEVDPENVVLPGGSAWMLNSPLTFGLADTLNKLSTTVAHVWCVRGGIGLDSGPSGAVTH